MVLAVRVSGSPAVAGSRGVHLPQGRDKHATRVLQTCLARPPALPEPPAVAILGVNRKAC